MGFSSYAPTLAVESGCMGSGIKQPHPENLQRKAPEISALCYKRLQFAIAVTEEFERILLQQPFRNTESTVSH